MAVSAAPVAAPVTVTDKAVGVPGKDVRSTCPRAAGTASSRRSGSCSSWSLRWPPSLIGHLVVFALAIVIGYYVIGHVHHALHTPLMSVTNAISGIIVVGALLQVGHDDLGITIVAALAILLASTTSSAVSP